MKRLLVIIFLGVFILTGCNKESTKSNTNTTKDEITINKIDSLSRSKIMANTTVIDENGLPEELKYLTSVTDLKVDMINEVYTKSDINSEIYDILHDFSFLYSKDNKSIKINLSRIEKPLRDTFYQSENIVSKVSGIDVIINSYDKEYLANFTTNNINFNIETKELSQNELLSLIKNIIKNK